MVSDRGLPQPCGLQLHLQASDCGHLLALVGELDLATSDQLVESLSALDGQPGQLVLDLALLEFIDAVGLRALLRVQRVVGERGGDLRLARPRPLVRRLLALTQLDSVLQVDTGRGAADTCAIPVSAP